VSLPSFQLLRPKTLDETVALMTKHAGEVKVVAGGTDLLRQRVSRQRLPPMVPMLRSTGEATAAWLWYNQSLLWRQSCGFCLKKDGDLCHIAPGGKFCWATFSGDTPPALKQKSKLPAQMACGVSHCQSST